MQFLIPDRQAGRRIPYGLLPLILFLWLVLLSGCSTMRNFYSSLFSAGKAPETAESLVQEGLDDFNHGKYYQALTIFDKIKNNYPFSQYSLLAELKTADSQYFLKNYPEALVLYGEFEERHPTNEAIPYIMFQTGMCHYKQIDTIDRDTTGATEAIQAFSRLLRAFPDSPYTEEARARIRAAKNFLANHEFYVATFYIRTTSYTEAEARLEYLLSSYPASDVAPKAQKLLADLKAGNPPKRTWRSWLPSIPLPHWRLFSFSKSEKTTKE